MPSPRTTNPITGAKLHGLSSIKGMLRKGAPVAAIFDVDGTLFPGRSGYLLIKEILGRRRPGRRDCLSIAARALMYLLGARGETTTIGAIGIAVRGWSEEELNEVGKRVAQQIDARMFPEARRLIECHSGLGHTVVLATAAARCVAEPLARDLGITSVLCSHFVVKAGFATGGVRTPTCWGEGKKQAIRVFAAGQGIDLAASYYFGDGREDFPAFSAVGNPCLVNPGNRLRREARIRGWSVLDLHRTDSLSTHFLGLPRAAKPIFVAGLRGMNWLAKRRARKLEGSGWLNEWVRINPDGRPVIILARAEMGQGVLTTLASLVSRELGVQPSDVVVEFAPCNSVYSNPASGIQATSASTSVATSWTELRKAGARARSRLIGTAAAAWSVPQCECSVRDGRVFHTQTNRCLTFAEILRMPLTEESSDANSSAPSDKYQHPRIDIPAKVEGSAKFGIDAGPSDSLVAVIQRPPSSESTLISADFRGAKSLDGVVDVLRTSAGVAIVARGFPAALRGRASLEVKWSRAPQGQPSGDELTRRRRALLDGASRCVRHVGDARRTMALAERLSAAEYELPMLAHAAIEPLSCVAQVTAKRCDVWAGLQNQAAAQRVASEVSGLGPSSVHIHTTLIGGSFGRRQETDFVAEAVEISKRMGLPVKVIWTREDDFARDYFRPSSFHRIQAAIGSDGLPTAWLHQICSPSVWKRVVPEYSRTVSSSALPRFMQGVGARAIAGVLRRVPDPNITMGADSVPYSIPHVRLEFAEDVAEAPIGFWRSVGDGPNAFVVETFIDELARATAEDPYLYRRRLLSKSPRHLRVLDAVAQASKWNGSVVTGDCWRGLAIHEASRTVVAQVVELSLLPGGAPKVRRVVCAVDCGRVLDATNVAAQAEGGIAMGLSATLHERMRMGTGAVLQRDFKTYPILKMHEMPEVEVHLVKSTAPPSGIGEAVVPPVAPAVANGMLAATGKAVRRLPLLG